MELHSLRVFLSVATEKSFSRAAEKMLRTQPAISLSIQRLEAQLGEKQAETQARWKLGSGRRPEPSSTGAILKLRNTAPSKMFIRPAQTEASPDPE